MIGCRPPYLMMEEGQEEEEEEEHDQHQEGAIGLHRPSLPLLVGLSMIVGVGLGLAIIGMMNYLSPPQQPPTTPATSFTSTTTTTSPQGTYQTRITTIIVVY